MKAAVSWALSCILSINLCCVACEADIRRWLLVGRQPSPQVRLPYFSRTGESPAKSVTPSPSVASSAARLQTPRVAGPVQLRRDDSAQSRAAVGRW